ncbi:MAG: hypothetical protein FJ279_36795, partial [Planctomycetes bacterium]|nr:hypothetical protein [Planctomycetota bacterium]
MTERFILLALAAVLLGRCCLGEILFDMRTASLRLDDAGRALSLRAADGTEYVMGSPQPAFWLRTKDGVQYPVSARKTGQTLTVAFKAHKAEFAVTEHDGFLLFELKDLTPSEGVERFQLLNIPLQATSEQAGTINARYYDGFAVCVMAAEVNVRPFSETSGGSRADREGCSHAFTQVADDVKVGRSAAKFTATSKLDQKTGWSVRGKRFPLPLDLTPCKAIRAWVRGDGKGESLKIQLNDGGKGYRDDYLVIDFSEWRQVTLAKPVVDTVNYANVVTLNFYYNGLPAKETVTCLID